MSSVIFTVTRSMVPLPPVFQVAVMANRAVLVGQLVEINHFLTAVLVRDVREKVVVQRLAPGVAPLAGGDDLRASSRS